MKERRKQRARDEKQKEDVRRVKEKGGKGDNH
jgi:hypothetical protein